MTYPHCTGNQSHGVSEFIIHGYFVGLSQKPPWLVREFSYGFSHDFLHKPWSIFGSSHKKVIFCCLFSYISTSKKLRDYFNYPSSCFWMFPMFFKPCVHLLGQEILVVPGRGNVAGSWRHRGFWWWTKPWKTSGKWRLKAEKRRKLWGFTWFYSTQKNNRGIVVADFMMAMLVNITWITMVWILTTIVFIGFIKTNKHKGTGAQTLYGG